MAAATKAKTDPRGLKRICTGCGIRFYDMNKRPIICPSCGTEFTGEIKVRTRRGRSAAAEDTQVEEKTAAPEAANDEAEEEATDVDVVSLDDAAAAEDNSDDDGEEVADADLDLDALESEEEGEDDLSGLEGDVDLSVETEKE